MSIGNRLRFAILQRDNFTCRYCGRSAPDVVLEVDHVDPRVAGGSNDPANLVTACFQCNRGKHDYDLDDTSRTDGTGDALRAFEVRAREQARSATERQTLGLVAEAVDGLPCPCCKNNVASVVAAAVAERMERWREFIALVDADDAAGEAAEALDEAEVH